MRYLVTVASLFLASAIFAAQERPALTAPSSTEQLPVVISGSTHPNPLVWDSMAKDATAKLAQTTNQFTFWVTNTAKTNVVLEHVQPSCGCTIAKLPKEPWNMAPGEFGPVTATINFPGLSGLVEKTLTVYTSEGQQTLHLKVTVPKSANIASRQENMNKAISDKQSVLKGDCASCHVENGKGKTGEDLFAADCTICHQPDGHRAEVVPNLANINKITSKEYWKYYLENGGPTVMPAFLNSKGGPLTAAEIDTFATFLNTKFPPKDPSQIKPVSAR
jgi:mono/diheme cytochrome c family protein